MPNRFVALMARQVRTPDGLGVDKAFDPTGHTAPTATRLEGLLAALEFLPMGKLRLSDVTVVHKGLKCLFRAQIRAGAYAGGLSRAMSLAASHATEVRIDHIQHALKFDCPSPVLLN